MAFDEGLKEQVAAAKTAILEKIAAAADELAERGAAAFAARGRAGRATGSRGIVGLDIRGGYPDAGSALPN